MLSRPHPRHGWLHLQPGDWRQCLQRQIEERDRLDDINHSGPAPAFVQWVDSEQMPRLAKVPHYHRQFQDRLTELQLKLSNLERDIAGGRLDLEPAAGLCRREIAWLQCLLEPAEVMP
jgi:hypothetical protein